MPDQQEPAKSSLEHPAPAQKIVDAPETIASEDRDVDERVLYKAMQYSREHRGPLPAPETLAAYEKIHPGMTKSLLAQLLAESTHRHDLENRLCDAEVARSVRKIDYASRGQLFGFILAGGGLLAALLVGLVNPTPTGATIAGILLGLPLASIISSFVVSRIGNKDESSNDDGVKPSDPPASPDGD